MVDRGEVAMSIIVLVSCIRILIRQKSLNITDTVIWLNGYALFSVLNLNYIPTSFECFKSICRFVYVIEFRSRIFLLCYFAIYINGLCFNSTFDDDVKSRYNPKMTSSVTA